MSSITCFVTNLIVIIALNNPVMAEQVNRVPELSDHGRPTDEQLQTIPGFRRGTINIVLSEGQRLEKELPGIVTIRQEIMTEEAGGGQTRTSNPICRGAVIGNEQQQCVLTSKHCFQEAQGSYEVLGPEESRKSQTKSAIASGHPRIIFDEETWKQCQSGKSISPADDVFIGKLSKPAGSYFKTSILSDRPVPIVTSSELKANSNLGVPGFILRKQYNKPEKVELRIFGDTVERFIRETKDTDPVTRKIHESLFGRSLSLSDGAIPGDSGSPVVVKYPDGYKIQGVLRGGIALDVVAHRNKILEKLKELGCD